MKLGIGKIAYVGSLFLNIGKSAALACPISQISNQIKEEIGSNDIRMLTGTSRSDLQVIEKALAVILGKVEEELGIILVPTSQAYFED